MSNLCILLVPYYHTFQKSVSRPYCLNYMNSSGEFASTRFTYNRKGQNDMAFYQQITGGRSSRNTHQFDKDGHMIRKEREYNDGETSLEIFDYDQKGRLLEESFENSKGVKGTARYEYDETDNAVRMICDGYKGWLKGKIEFEIDSLGKRIAAKIIREDGPDGSIEFKYDIHGHLVQEIWTIGDWNQTFGYTYEDVES